MMREIRNASEWIRCARRRDTSGSVSARSVSARRPERAHRCLQLVADVGDEVATYFLEPSPLRDVVDDRDDSECALAVVDALGADRQRPARRTVELEGALLGSTGGGRGEQVVDGLGGKGVTMAATHQRDGAAVAEDEVAVFVTDDHRLGEGVEDAAQPDRVGTGVGDGLGGVFRRALDVTERVLDPLRVHRQRVRAEPVAERDEALLQRFHPATASDRVRRADEDDGDPGCDRDIRGSHAQLGDHESRRGTGTPPALQFVGRFPGLSMKHLETT